MESLSCWFVILLLLLLFKLLIEKTLEDRGFISLSLIREVSDPSENIFFRLETTLLQTSVDVLHHRMNAHSFLVQG